MGAGAEPIWRIPVFAKAIVEGTSIRLFNHDKMCRGFTHIDEVTVVLRLVDLIPGDDARVGCAQARSHDVGNHHPEERAHLLALLEKELDRTAVKDMLPMRPGDVIELSPTLLI